MATFEFQAETRELLDLMIHAIYSNKEIFLRELISNASDALDKLKFASLTEPALAEGAADPHIRLSVDGGERTLTVSDNGIGMSRAEVVDYVGTIAKSGSKEFLAALRANEGKVPPELIGQFGVGLYSSFMVADRVTLVTRRAGETSATRFTSTGDGTYDVDDADRDGCGTDVTLHLKPVDREDGIRDYTKDWVLRELVKRYSDYVAHPIRMRVEATEVERDEQGEATQKTTVHDEVLNSGQAIWRRNPDELQPSDYHEFYKHVAHDWNEPLLHIHFKAEGTVEFRSLLFVPKQSPADLVLQRDGTEPRNGVQLYIKRVFIMQDCKDLIPTYMRFVRGVVDTEDLSLNISREMLQQDRMIRLIRNRLTTKVLDTLVDLKSRERATFDRFWAEFGSIFKEGIVQDSRNKERILDLCTFHSTRGDESTSLPDYVERMGSDQKCIYYMTGPSRSAVVHSPHLETFRAKGVEVLVLTDAIDEVWAETTVDYRDLPFRCVGKGTVELGSDDERRAAREALEHREHQYAALLTFIAGRLEDHVKEVRLSTRLTTSPVCLVGAPADITPHMEDLLRRMGKDVPPIKRILELNPDHPIVVGLERQYAMNPADPLLDDYCEVLYGQALLAEGTLPTDPGRFSQKVAMLMTKALECLNAESHGHDDLN